MGDAFPISGNIDASIPFLLVSLNRQGATGSLKVDGPSYQKALYFRGGRVLFGSSNDPRDQLGSILVESGRITPEQLEDVSTKVGPGNPLARALADSGFVSQRELSEAARTKVELIVADMMAYTSGTFEFEDGVLPKGAIDLKLNSEKLFLAAARRVSARGFVLLHLGGLDVVLTPRPNAEHFEELRPECGGLLEALDGKRTLKEAIALTRLDEFEAGKLACGLVFLEIVAKSASHPEFLPADDGTDLELAQAAQAVFQPDLVAPANDEPFFLPDVAPDAPTSAPAPPTPLPEFVLPPPPEPAPLISEPTVMTAAAPTVLMAPVREQEIPSVAAPPRRSVTPGGSHLPLVPPPPRGTPIRTIVPEAEPELVMPRHGNAPSRADLAAVDALLHSRSIEAPLSGATRPTPRPPAWEPRFGQAARPARARGGPSPALVGTIVVLLLVAGAAAWFLWLGPQFGSKIKSAQAQPSPVPIPTAKTTGLAVAPSPTAIPTVAAATPVPAPSPIVISTPTPAPTAPPTPPTRTTSPASLADARAALRRGAVSDAGRAFAQVLRGTARGQHTVQVLVACSDETITKALQSVPAEELFVIPVTLKGRACERLCWGLYDSAARAQSALNSVPAYFRDGGANPKVVATADILP
jgi:Domain of unknown function (DUF4388)